jgi:thiosulfate/3-mercaptopyruvate sulfurtransferase
MVRDPSAVGACDDVSCHGDIAAQTQNSLHTNLWGEKHLIEQRGQTSISMYQTQYDAKCGTCHTTCGQCHVSRPNSVGGGLIRNGGHKFRESPHNTEQCTACHGSRIAFDYTGENPGNQQDVHRSYGFLCENCHSAQEIHGDGLSTNASGHYEHRYEVSSMPRCENCHETEASTNSYHTAHWNGWTNVDLQCQVCHSQSYKNCTNCHLTAGAYELEPSVLSFKIGHNTLESTVRDYDYVVVRHVPIHQDTYSHWGLSLPNYDDVPTWKYASPHNIVKWTDQTTVNGGSCGSSCHDQAGQNPKGFYLREVDLLDNGTPLPDQNANQNVVIKESDLH